MNISTTIGALGEITPEQYLIADKVGRNIAKQRRVRYGDLDDVLVDARMGAVRAVNSYREGVGTLKGWISFCASKEILDGFRRRAWCHMREGDAGHVFKPDPLMFEKDTDFDKHSIELGYEEIESTNTVNSLLSSSALTENQREALTLMYIRNLTVDEIATRLDILYPTAYKRIRDGEAALRKRYAHQKPMYSA